EMSLVVEHSTAHLKPEDLQSIAAYLKTLSPVASASSGRVTPQGAEATTKKLTAAKDLSVGERLYLDNCAACHFVNGKGA
ncbi:alcohol dehydrogenase, partial [Acinetobacter baumannii]